MAHRVPISGHSASVAKIVPYGRGMILSKILHGYMYGFKWAFCLMYKNLLTLYYFYHEAGPRDYFLLSLA